MHCQYNQAFIRSPHLYRRQAGVLLLGALAPWVGNALYISGLGPFPHLDLTPFAFTLTGLAAAWGLFRFRLLDIVPVARDAVIESMSDGVIVLDLQNRVADLNPVAQRIIGRSAAEAIGQPAAQVLSGLADLVERYRDVTEAREELILGEGEAQSCFDLRLLPLYDLRCRLTGRLVVLRDITEHKRAEEALVQLGGNPSVVICSKGIVRSPSGAAFLVVFGRFIAGSRRARSGSGDSWRA